MTSFLEGKTFGGSKEPPDLLDGEENVITTVQIQRGSTSKWLILTKSRFYERRIVMKKEIPDVTESEITTRSPILREVIELEGQEMKVVDYGSDEIVGDVEVIQKSIAKIGGISSQYFKTAVSTIIEAQRAKATKRIAYSCAGVYFNTAENRWVIAAPQYNTIYVAKHLAANGEANNVIEHLNGVQVPTYEQIKKTLEGYAVIPEFSSAIETVPVLGYDAVAPMFFVLKDIEKKDYFMQMLEHGGPGLGKSTNLNYGTVDLYGTPLLGKEHITSATRYMQTLNSTGFPLHVAELKTFDFDLLADLLKNGTDQTNVGSRYNGDMNRSNFLGRAPLTYSANGIKISDSASISRMLIIKVDADKKDRQKRWVEFNQNVIDKIKGVHIGYSLLENILAKYATPQEMMNEIKAIQDDLIEMSKKRPTEIKWLDIRRSLTYAAIFFGIKEWQRFILSHHPEYAEPEHAEKWFNKYSNMEQFIVDLVAPLEDLTTEVMEHVPAASFIAWLKGWIIAHGTAEEGRTWGWSSNGKAIFVTTTTLEHYKEHARRVGNGIFETLPQLAADVGAYLGIPIKAYPTDLRLGGEVMSQNVRVVKVPIIDQMELVNEPVAVS